MSRRAATWGAATAASLAAHAGFVALIAVAVRPGPPPPAPPPEMRLEIETHRVEGSEAAETPPDAVPAEEGQPGEARATQAAVPVSRARPAEPSVERAAASDAPAELAAESQPLASPTQAAPAKADAATAAPARPSAAVAVEPRPERIATLAAGSTPVSTDPGTAAGLALGAEPVTAAERAAEAVSPSVHVAAANPNTPRIREVQAEGAGAAAEVSAAAGRVVEIVATDSATLAPVQPLREQPVVEASSGSAPALTSEPPSVHLAGSEPAPAPALAVRADAAPIRQAAGNAQAAADVAADGARLSAAAAAAQAAPVRPPDGVALPGRAARGPSGRRLAPRAGTPAEPAVAEFSVVAAAFQAPTDRVSATLAWSGGADVRVDPVSLAAIESFMRPGDVAAEAGGVADSLADTLASMPCARLQTAFLPESGVLELRGHVPQETLRGPVMAALRQQIGDAIPVMDNLLVLPRPQCSVLSGIAAAGLPQSTDQLTNPRVIGPDAHARAYTFTEGERLALDVTGPDYPAYFYVDYYDAEGMVIHLQPNEIVGLRRVAPAEEVTVGMGEGALEMRVAPPFGQEIVVALASSVPLFEETRPLREPAGPYLEELARRIELARMREPAFKGEWVYFFVSTRAG